MEAHRDFLYDSQVYLRLFGLAIQPGLLAAYSGAYLCPTGRLRSGFFGSRFLGAGFGAGVHLWAFLTGAILRKLIGFAFRHRSLSTWKTLRHLGAQESQFRLDLDELRLSEIFSSDLEPARHSHRIYYRAHMELTEIIARFIHAPLP
ncbi:hypothetical protein [Streptomyces sp. NPDC020298]|uniref:hypothetical protein n=1 Tax=Streptomyces sp. NPDC020298 TaxID=3155010 RepID=UPI0033E9D6CC